MNYSLNNLYEVVGISKQAVYQYDKRQNKYNAQLLSLLPLVDAIRAEHPGCGVEKMYYTINPDFIGRDRFIELFMDLGYRLKRYRNYHKTTISSNKYYPNLIPGIEMRKPSTIWQTDITYFRVKEKFYYGIFVIDAYTKQIVGHQVSDHMRATANITAIKKAFKNFKPPSYHHSDRGSQYTSKEYTKILEANGSKISMGLKAQDNAYAERINRTIKEEYLSHWKPDNYKQLVRLVNKAVKNYNAKRLHNAFRPLKMTPNEFENYVLLLPEQERPTEIIYTEVENKIGEASSFSNLEQELSQDHN